LITFEPERLWLDVLLCEPLGWWPRLDLVLCDFDGVWLAALLCEPIGTCVLELFLAWLRSVEWPCELCFQWLRSVLWSLELFL
jgi:hypothetical protein